MDQATLAREAADALVGLGVDPVHLVTSCRRMVDRHPMAGAIWTLAARVLTAPDARRAARDVADELAMDATARHVADDLPDGARVCIVSYPDVAASELGRRGDIEVRVLDAYGEGAGLARRLAGHDVEVVEIPLTGVGAAVSTADVVVVEAAVAGPAGLIAPAGSLAAAATGYVSGVDVVGVVPAGRALPEPLFEVVCGRLDDEDPWENDDELVHAGLLSRLVGPDGVSEPGALASRADCPMAPELLRTSLPG